MSDMLSRLRVIVDTAQAATGAKDLQALRVEAVKVDTAITTTGRTSKMAATQLADMAGSSKRAAGALAEAGGATRLLGGAVTVAVVGVLALGVALRRIAQAGDEFSIINNRIKEFAGGTASAAAMQERLTAIAMQTHRPLQDVVKDYEEMARKARETGDSQETIVRQLQSMSVSSDKLRGTLSGGWAVFNSGLDYALGKLDDMLGLSRAIGGILERVGKFLGPDAPSRPRVRLAGILPTVTVTEDAYTPEQLASRRRAAAQRQEAAEREAAQRRAEAIEAAQEDALGRRAFQQQRAFQNLARNPLAGVSGTGGVADMVYAGRGDDRVKMLADDARQSQAIFQSFADGMQRTLSGAISGLFTDGLSSAANFARGLRDLLINAFSEVVASRAVAALLGNGGGLSLASGGGLLGALGMGGGAGKLGNIAKGGGGFNFGAGALAGIGGLGVGATLGQSFGTGAGVLGGAASGAALGTIVPGIGNVAGAIIGGLAGAIGGLFGGTARKRAKEAEKAAIDAAKRTYGDDGVSAGTYLAPAGFSAASYRFTAGRPSVITGNVFNVNVPPGTSPEQARSMLEQFEALARAQGLGTGTLPRVR